MQLINIESLKGVPTEIADALARSNVWFILFAGLIAVGLFLRLAAPFIRGVAVLLDVIRKNSERNEALQEAAKEHLKQSAVASDRNKVHGQRLKRTNQTTRKS